MGRTKSHAYQGTNGCYDMSHELSAYDMETRNLALTFSSIAMVLIALLLSYALWEAKQGQHLEVERLEEIPSGCIYYLKGFEGGPGWKVFDPTCGLK